ncbi:MAG: hypothetical protein CVT84_13250 [Alphaproteobacteria bacterium HGW-Alphaproteobacteria-6]|nr:MAG: hypothetical protein CVT84_13250 [Alphaproteobacteria bacterium HGW-Alphaproteobacteria-6]
MEDPMANPRLAAALIAAFATLAGGAGPAVAAEDGGWPCIQRRTGALSAAVIWPHPLPAAEAAALPAGAADLAAALALRRISPEAAEARLATYLANHPGTGAEAIGAIFLAALTRIDRDRNRVLDGIGRYARSQAGLAARIDAGHAALKAAETAEPLDFDRIDAIGTQLDWDERIYHDRERALGYVCETPVLLEKRAFQVAQMLLRQLPQ